ncbi:hypothetical protein ACFYUY_01400 [Kitasatospora sp. NPDC004745]|uniref:hypothetical protein n=1 Tax=Kitasatospora sp. NPDC004745 TaxID=3364019 RepID=UPI003684F6DC
MNHVVPTPPPRTTPGDQPNPTGIAVLEHDLFGIQPEKGSLAALAIALRVTGTCINHQAVETTHLGDPRPAGICTGCGTNMIETDGEWRVA